MPQMDSNIGVSIKKWTGFFLCDVYFSDWLYVDLNCQEAVYLVSVSTAPWKIYSKHYVKSTSVIVVCGIQNSFVDELFYNMLKLVEVKYQKQSFADEAGK